MDWASLGERNGKEKSRERVDGFGKEKGIMVQKGKKRKKDGLRLTDKKHPRGGIAATGLALLSMIIFMIVCFHSGESRGNSGIEAGVIGIFCFLVSIGGFILAWLTLRLDNIRTVFPSIGVVLNGLLMLFYLIVYILGTA